MAPSANIINQTYIANKRNNYIDLNLVSVDHGGNNDEQHNGTSYGAVAAKEMVQDALLKKIATIDVDTCQPGEEDAFYVADLGEVYRQHQRWKTSLGRVKPFYGPSITSILCTSFT